MAPKRPRYLRRDTVRMIKNQDGTAPSRLIRTTTQRVWLGYSAGRQQGLENTALFLQIGKLQIGKLQTESYQNRLALATVSPSYWSRVTPAPRAGAFPISSSVPLSIPPPRRMAFLSYVRPNAATLPELPSAT